MIPRREIQVSEILLDQQRIRAS